MSDVKNPVRWRMLEIAAYFLLVNIVILLSMGALIRVSRGRCVMSCELRSLLCHFFLALCFHLFSCIIFSVRLPVRKEVEIVSSVSQQNHESWYSFSLFSCGNNVYWIRPSKIIKHTRVLYRHSTDSNNSRSKTTLVTTQGLWFIMAYMAVVFPSLFALVMTPTPGYILFMACLHPLQGFLNAFVYFRPKYESERRRTVSSTIPVERRPTRMSSVLRVLNIPLGALEGGNPPKNNAMHSPGVGCNGNEFKQDNEAVWYISDENILFCECCGTVFHFTAV